MAKLNDAIRRMLPQAFLEAMEMHDKAKMDQFMGRERARTRSTEPPTVPEGAADDNPEDVQEAPAPAVSPQVRRRPVEKRVDNPGQSPHYQLTRSLPVIFEETKRSKYLFNPRDAKELKSLLEQLSHLGPEEQVKEVERRWRIALTNKFRKAATITELYQKWNAFAEGDDESTTTGRVHKPFPSPDTTPWVSTDIKDI